MMLIASPSTLAGIRPTTPSRSPNTCSILPESCPRTLSLYAKGGLTSSGYKPVTNGNTQYVLDVILDNEPAIYRDNAYWVFANLELKLKDTQSSKVIGTCSWQLKEGSQGKDRAVKKVLDSVKVIFDNEFDHVFKAFVSSKPCKGEE